MKALTQPFLVENLQSEKKSTQHSSQLVSGGVDMKEEKSEYIRAPFLALLKALLTFFTRNLYMSRITSIPWLEMTYS
jgi:hypothetical protein